MLGLITIDKFIMIMHETGCVIEEPLNMNITKFVKYLDTFYFNNYYLIIEILIKYFKKNDLEKSFVVIV